MSSMITARVPKELKEKMKKASHINWSEVIRKAIEEKILAEERRRSLKNAANVMDEIRNNLLRAYGPTCYDSVEVIKLWRSLRK